MKWILPTLLFCASTSVFAADAKEKDLGKLVCQAIAINSANKKEHIFETQSIAFSELKKGNSGLLLNYNDVVMFHVKYVDGFYVTYFAVEDEGGQADTAGEFKGEAKFKNYEKSFKINISIDRDDITPPIKMNISKVVARCRTTN